VGQESVADLTRDLGHLLADGGEEHLGRTERIGAGIEERRHQRVGVEVAAEVELGAVVPAVPDGAHGEDELAHASGGVGPRHAEALLDVGLDLAAEAEHEPTLGRELQVVADLGQHHGAARERDRDARAQLDALGLHSREEEREERVVGRLGRPHPVVAHVLLDLGRLAKLTVESEPDASVHLHGADDRPSQP
jgi:hypothetical protein